MSKIIEVKKMPLEEANAFVKNPGVNPKNFWWYSYAEFTGDGKTLMSTLDTW